MKYRANTKESLPKFLTNSIRIQKLYSLSDALAYIARIRTAECHFPYELTESASLPVWGWGNTAGVALAILQTFHCTLPVYYIPEIKVSLKIEGSYSLCWVTYFSILVKCLSLQWHFSWRCRSVRNRIEITNLLYPDCSAAGLGMICILERGSVFNQGVRWLICDGSYNWLGN